jgi:hypothetical protein
VGNFHPAQHEPAACDQRMHIITDTDMDHTLEL